MPSIKALARELGFSQVLIRRAQEELVRRGYLAIRPRFGAFVRLRPADPASPAPSLSGGTNTPVATVRLYASEMEYPASLHWRALIRAFEERHREVRVEISMVQEGAWPFAGADLFFLHTDATNRLAENDLLPWVREAGLRHADLAWPLDETERLRTDAYAWPIGFSLHTLFANRRLLENAGAYRPEAWTCVEGLIETCRLAHAGGRIASAAPWGWVISCLAAPLLYCGLGTATGRASLKALLTALATEPPPQVVTEADVLDPRFGLSALSESRALLVSGFSWQGAVAPRETWVPLPAPNPGGVSAMAGRMFVSISRHTRHPEVCRRFAGFLAGPEGQRILAGIGGLLPTHRNAIARHPACAVYRTVAPRRSSAARSAGRTQPSIGEKELQVLREVRTHRLSVEEALARLDGAGTSNL